MKPLAALAAVWWVTALAPGQTPVFSGRVEMVRLDVLVTAGGRPVTGLTRDDFEVRDNGVLQDISLLGVDDGPLSVVLTLDLSASVEGERLANLRAAGRALLDGLRPNDQVSLIAFNHMVSRLSRFTSAFGEVRAALDAATPSGGTALVDASFASLVVAESDGRRGLAVLFSDGLDTTSWLTETQAIESARRSETIVYGVAVAQRSGGPEFLRDVTAISGGRMLEVRDADELAGAFVSVLSEFRERYLLSYTPTGVDQPGWHSVDVRVRRRGADVRTRQGYVR
ncbi:MAG TPA: VWA domain-containing protein [Vicinamibacterales bacterium]|nr:VWA domain-containing protein [Vicinamibacterales bacterium]